MKTKRIDTSKLPRPTCQCGGPNTVLATDRKTWLCVRCFATFVDIEAAERYIEARKVAKEA